ncbi:MAG: iron-sulfur cluster assembly accessory protein [Aquimonas sp.]|nr:iron-sulfur cluster assembly accessory protein [Aquimonas sp.]
MAIHLTAAAVERVRQFMGREPGSLGLRFGVKRTGCSGWGYTVDVARQIAADDTVVEQDGVKVVIDANSLPLVDGTEIDFVRQGLNQQFAFRNPQAAAACGCGESFTTA